MQKSLVPAAALSAVSLLAAACGDLGAPQDAPQRPAPAVDVASQVAASAPAQPETRPSADADAIRALADEVGRLRAQLALMQHAAEAAKPVLVQREDSAASASAAGETAQGEAPAVPPAAAGPQVPVQGAGADASKPEATVVQTVIEREVPVYVDREVSVYVDREVPVYIDREVPVVVDCAEPAPIVVWSFGRGGGHDGRRGEDDRGHGRPDVGRNDANGHRAPDARPSRREPAAPPPPPRVVPHPVDRGSIEPPAPAPTEPRGPASPQEPRAPRRPREPAAGGDAPAPERPRQHGRTDVPRASQPEIPTPMPPPPVHEPRDAGHGRSPLPTERPQRDPAPPPAPPVIVPTREPAPPPPAPPVPPPPPPPPPRRHHKN